VVRCRNSQCARTGRTGGDEPTTRLSPSIQRNLCPWALLSDRYRLYLVSRPSPVLVVSKLGDVVRAYALRYFPTSADCFCSLATSLPFPYSGLLPPTDRLASVRLPFLTAISTNLATQWGTVSGLRSRQPACTLTEAPRKRGTDESPRVSRGKVLSSCNLDDSFAAYAAVAQAFE
jgi:hypothetical protein